MSDACSEKVYYTGPYLLAGLEDIPWALERAVGRVELAPSIRRSWTHRLEGPTTQRCQKASVLGSRYVYLSKNPPFCRASTQPQKHVYLAPMRPYSYWLLGVVFPNNRRLCGLNGFWEYLDSESLRVAPFAGAICPSPRDSRLSSSQAHAKFDAPSSMWEFLE